MEFNSTEKPITSAVSLYGDAAGIDDFPVLKAFQQYVDAEQSKARKRLIWLCSIFAVVTIIIVLSFTLVISRISAKYDKRSFELNQRNQELNDRLVEYAMKERERVNETTTAKDESTGKLLAALAAIQQQMANAQQQQQSNAVPDPAATRERAKLEAERQEVNRQRLENAEQLKRARALLAAEREKLRQQEIEIQRRRLYPDYYKAKDEVELENSMGKQPPSTSPSGKSKSAPNYKTNPDGTINYFESEEQGPDSEEMNSSTSTEDIIEEIIHTPSSWAIPD